MKKIVYLFIAFIAIGFSAKAQDSLAQFTGKYNFPEGSIVSYVTVTAEGGKLSFSSDKGTGTLERISADSFAIPEYQGTGKYTRNADNKIIGVVIDVMGYHLEGVKDAAIVLIDRQLYLKSERKQFTIR
jgi:hypothetical protein